MPAPRVFVSSTFYDLKIVRADLDALEHEMGVEIVRFENASIPYQAAHTLPEACCKEIDNCNILLSIVGGRAGSRVRLSDKTVVKTMLPGVKPAAPEETVTFSRLEVDRAVKSGLMLFFFVDAEVNSEYHTYTVNRENARNIRWRTVDSIEVFELLDHVHGLDRVNPVFDFRTSRDIIDILRRQLSTLFHDLLNRVKLNQFASHVEMLIESAEKLESMQSALRGKEAEFERRIREVKRMNHPLFVEVARVTGLPTAVVFKTADELDGWMKFCQFTRMPDAAVQNGPPRYYYHNLKSGKQKRYIGVAKECFDAINGEVILAEDGWRQDLVYSGELLPSD